MLREIVIDKFLSTFNKYKKYTPDNIVLKNSDTYFTIAGMKQFVNYFMGEIPKDQYISTIQPCIRLNDIDKIGTTKRHVSFFEMLGVFSFGECNKFDIINSIYRYFVNELEMNPAKMFYTVYHTDDEAQNIWTSLVGNKVMTIQTDDNFWSVGQYGVCGPCTEIYYNTTDKNYTLDEAKQLILDGRDDILEIGNIVFMQYNRTQNGLEKLSKPNIDVGLGLGRILSVIDKSFDIFETEIIKPIFNIVKNKIATDSIITSLMIMREGIIPSIDGVGYVIRKLLRRVFYNSNINDFQPIISELIKIYNIDFNIDLSIIEHEKKLFNDVLLKSKKILDNIKNEEDLCIAYHTHGVPMDLIEIFIKKNNMSYDTFNEFLKKHKSISKKFEIEYNTPTICKYYELDEIETKIDYIHKLNDNEFLMVTEASCCYPRGGGQEGDIGIFTGEISNGKILDTFKKNITFDKIVIIHKCSGIVNIGNKIKISIDRRMREANMRAHTGIHLVGEYLMKKYGCKQIGSYIKDDYARIDLNIEKSSINDDVISHVNEAIKKKIDVKVTYEKLSEISDCIYDGEYGDIVRVLEIPGYSKQLCGGTHVKNTSDIFNIHLRKIVNIGNGKCRVEIYTNKL